MNQRKIAFITGIAGQDGAYLAEFLCNKNYDVHGLVRWDSYVDPLDGLERLDKLGLVNDKISLHTGDLTDSLALAALIKKIKPDEIYNLAALSHVAVSFDTPAAALEINTKGTLAIFDAVRLLNMEENVRIYQASSSEMFGSSPGPQNEETPMHPCSPYGTAKLASYWLGRTYRDSYNIHISNGILFNHESPARGEDFVTRKITKAVAAIEYGAQKILELGNLDSVRDWGHARDYVRGMWMILQQDSPDDYVLATGQAKTVRAFVERAFAHTGITIEWRGFGINEIGRHAKTKKTLVRVNPKFFRPKDVNYLLGDASKARRVLGWKPSFYFDDLVSDMVNADRRILREKQPTEHIPWQQVG